MARADSGHSTPRVLVNDRPLIGPRTGVGMYLAGVVGAWPEDQPAPVGVVGRLSRNLMARTDQQPQAPAQISSVRPIVRTALRGLRARNDAQTEFGRGVKRAGYARAARAAMSMMRRHQGDVIWEPNHHPLVSEKPGSPVVTTIHDLSVLQRPEFHPPDRVRFWAKALPKTLERTSEFIAVSQATARAVVSELGVPSDRVHAVPLAPRFDGAPEGWTRETCRRALGLNPDRPLALHLGTIEPRKNLGVLLDAWKILSERSGIGGREHPELMLVGSPGWGDAAFWHRLTSHTMSDRVRCTGYIDDHAVVALLIAADVVLCPSLLEGFGLPAVEAMRVGTPTIVSTDPALREAVGDAAPSLDPREPEAWANAVEELINNPELGDERAGAGIAHTSNRTWHDVAREHADLFARVHNEPQA